jgi:ATP-dependent helicase HrpA
VRASLGNAAQLALASAPHASPRAVLEDAIVAAVDALIAEAGGPAWDAAGFARLRERVAGELADRAAAIAAQVVAILDAARAVRAALEPLTAVALQPARADVERQLDRLVHPGFVAESGAARLPDVARYLQAALRRLERLPNAPAPDRDRMGAIHELERAYRRRLEAWPPGRPLPPALRDVPWMLEELRVSHFAQHLGTRGPVSAKRIRAAIEGR